MRWIAGICALIVAAPLLGADDAGRVVGLAFTGRVADLDQSVAFYSALGFERDPSAPSAWGGDEVIRQLYGALLTRALAAGATPVADKRIVTMSSGTREIMLRDPDTGAFVLLFEPKR